MHVRSCKIMTSFSTRNKKMWMKRNKTITKCVLITLAKKLQSFTLTTKLSLGYKNHKSCKILPKFLPTLHFLQESYKFVRESQFLQDWYIALYFLQDSCKKFAKFAYFIQKFLQNLRFSFLIISTKNSFKFFSDLISYLYLNF